MKLYELSFLVVPEIKEEDANQINQKIISLIQEKGGALDNLDTTKLINLAYEIEKKLQAYFSSFSFYLQAKNIAELEKNIKDNKNIIRYLLIIREKPRPTKRLIKKEKRQLKSRVYKTKSNIEQIEEKLYEILEKGIEEEIK